MIFRRRIMFIFEQYRLAFSLLAINMPSKILKIMTVIGTG